jgi:hypothetical protein
MALYLKNHTTMKKNFFFFLLFFFSISLNAQETDNRGTIKIQKKSKLHAVIFDNINNRLVGQDIYGNILDSAIFSFNVMITIKGIAYKESILGTTLSPTMQNRIKNIDTETTLLFTEVKVVEKNGTSSDWPKFSAKIGHTFEKEE